MSLDLLGIFGAGILTLISPCVLPLLPIYLSALIGADIRKLKERARGQLMLRTAWFVAGFTLVFTLLGLAASSVGAFLINHKPILQAVGALLIFVFGLKFLGILQISWLDRIVRADDRKLQSRFAWVNALVMGIVFAAGWSPCAGPVLGSVLTYTASTTSNPWVGACYLATYGLGFALPLLLLAVFAGAGSRLIARIGPHLSKIERVIGVLLLLVAGSLTLDLVRGQIQKSPVADGNRHQAVDDQAKRQPTMVAFVSSKCGICEGMKPLLESLKKQCQGKNVLIQEFDLSDTSLRHLISDYRLVGTPTFVFLNRAGIEVARLVGEQTEATLKQALSAVLGKPCPGLALLAPDQDNGA